MSEQQLRDLLRDKAETVEAPALAESSWRLAGVRRRRRRTAFGSVTAAVVALIVTGGLVTAQHQHARPDHSVVGSAAPSPSDKLPTAPTQLPRTIDTDPSDAGRLSKNPVRHALGIFAAYPKDWPQNAPEYSTVLVLGDDGRMRRIDTTSILGSQDGLAPAPILPGALDQNGTMAAFPQPDGYVLTVDLTGTAHHRYRVGTGGPVESLWWAGTDRLVLGTSTRTHLLDVRTGAVRTLPFGAALVPEQPTNQPGYVTFGTASDAGTTIRRYGPDGQLTGTVRSDWWYSHWYGPGFTAGPLAVRTAFGSRQNPKGGGNTIVATPLSGGDTRAWAIDCPIDGPELKFSCELLGLPQTYRAMVLDHAHPQHQLLLADLGTGQFSAVSRLTRDGQVALAPWAY
jgi:hypothetical protein